ncbi:MAG: hypothetical protein JOS17DRAFT_786096 [Linnemannia elongata]|nr:MAG: hypothetical protein JOS17DRAFT_786096 [Linnemannia elongata]
MRPRQSPLEHHIYAHTLGTINCIDTSRTPEGFGWLEDLVKTQWFRLFERSVLGSGALKKNGRWIRKVDPQYCGMIDLLTGTANGGSGEVFCDELVELEIGDGNRYDLFSDLGEEVPTPQPQEVHVPSVIRLLQRNQAQLRKLKFSETLLSTNLEDSIRMIRAIPSSVKELSIDNWVPSLPTSATSTPNSDPVLSNLKTSMFNNSDIDNLLPTLRQSPALEILVLNNFSHTATDSAPWYVLALTIKHSCPLLTSLRLIDCPPYSDEEFTALTEAVLAAGKHLDPPRQIEKRLSLFIAKMHQLGLPELVRGKRLAEAGVNA